MKISPSGLAGYILEEVLAYLVRMTGYDLLVDDTQDPVGLRMGPNGLRVIGRGGEHQVDVLGQLRWVPTFTFPLRLFIEAKFRRWPMGVPVVRNAVGAIIDINQFNQFTREEPSISPKYHYAYAIFSTSGFWDDAQEMALAHQISLVDLSGNEYSQLRNGILSTAHDLRRFLSTDPERRKTTRVRDIRDTLRKDLGTLPPNEGEATDTFWDSEISRRLSTVVEAARQTGELFPAMVNGPYMLLLNATDPLKFVQYCKKHPTHKVRIRLATVFGPSSPWRITPVQTDSNEGSYELSFTIPSRISQWIFDLSATRDPRSRARDVKKTLLSTISIIRHEEQQDYVFRLEWDSELVTRVTEDDLRS